METQPVLDWVLSFIQTQGVGAFLILFGLWFLDRRLWPIIRDVVVVTWAETRKAEAALLARAVVALEELSSAARSSRLSIHPPEQ